MTQREFFNAVINGTVTEEMVQFANESIAKLDARNSKRAEQRVDKHADERIAIANVLTDKPMLASEIAKGLDLSVSKVSALCRQMVGDGVLTVEDVKVKGKGTQKSYSLA